MELEEIKDILQHECFETLSNMDFENIAKNSTILSFKKGENIIKQGSFITHICYVLKGLSKINIEINETNSTVRIVPIDRFIGIQYAFTGNINQFSAVAVENSEILMIDINCFKQLMTTNGFFALEIAKTISTICEKMISRILLYRSKNIEGSLASFLIHYSKIFKSNKFIIPFTRIEIAEMLGYSRESVIHTFTKFNKDGILIVKDKNINIIDIDLLKNISIRG
jgi:CRP-like cAMP-binding protein